MYIIFNILLRCEIQRSNYRKRIQVAERKMDVMTVEVQSLNDTVALKNVCIAELQKTNISMQQIIVEATSNDAVPTNEPKLSCAICLAAKPPNDFAVPTGCSHAICLSCHLRLTADSLAEDNIQKVYNKVCFSSFFILFFSFFFFFLFFSFFFSFFCKFFL